MITDEQVAYKVGFTDYNNGKSEHQCFYKVEALRFAWHDGWMDAKDKAEAAKAANQAAAAANQAAAAAESTKSRANEG